MKKSNLWFSTIVMCVMCVICISCSEDEEEPYLILKPVSISLKSTGEASEPLVIESNTSWKVTTNEIWLKPSKTEGNGNATVDLKADPNPWERDRKVSIIVTTGTITKNLWITQGHDELTVSGDDVILTEEEGASGKFNIQTNGEWSITDVPDWLELSDTMGSGDAEVTVTAIKRNYGDELRDVSLKVVSAAVQKFVRVKQANTYLKITSGSTLALNYSSGVTGKFSISTNGSWNITEIPSWLKVSTTEGSWNMEITVTTTSTNSTEYERSATMKITVGPLEANVNVKQAAGLSARISAPIVLSNGCYFEFDLGAAYGGYSSILYDASYFDSQTEESIYSEVKNATNISVSSQNYAVYADLPTEKEFVMCMIPYRNQTGMVRWGNLHTMHVKTPSENVSAGVTISSIGYNSTQWTVTIYSFGTHYYLMALENEDAVSAYTDRVPDILYAAAMYQANVQQTLAGDLYAPRSYFDYALYLIGWGGTRYGNITRRYGYIPGYGVPQHAQVTPQTGPKFSKQDNAKFERLQEALRQNNNVRMQVKVPLR